MSRSMSKENYREINNHKQGRTGSKVMKKPGPAKGRGSGNKTNSGGIVKPTKGRV